VNTTDSDYKKVVPVSELRPEEAAALPRADTRPKHHNHGNIATTRLYEEMSDRDDPEPLQEVPVGDLLCALFDTEDGSEVRQIESLIVMSDGTLFATVAGEDGGTLDEMPGFRGLLKVEEAQGCETDEEVVARIDETRL